MIYIPGLHQKPWVNDNPTIANALIEGVFSSLVETQYECLLCKVLECMKSDSKIDAFYLYNHLEQEIPIEILKQYNYLLASVVMSTILQGKEKSSFLNGITFCGREFYLDKNVLTPHIQTQELTYATIGYIEELFDNKQSLKALDMCCGSGVIGLSIASAVKNLSMVLSDISIDALKVSVVNAKCLETSIKKLNNQVQVILSDLFENIHGMYDIITANPPYLSNEERIPKAVYQLLANGAEEVQYYQGTLSNEPNISLFAKDNGLEYYRLIAEQLNNHLKERSLSVLEFGGNSQQHAVNDIIIKYLKDAEILYLYSMKNNSPRAAFIFRGFTSEEIEKVTPKVLKKIPPVKLSKQFNITERRINKLGN